VHYATDLASALDSDAPTFCDFLIQNGLAPLWNDFLRKEQQGSGPAIPPLVTDRVKHARIASAAMYLLQRQTLCTTSAALDAAGIAYAVIKGGGLRERLYTDPSLRPMDDLDILVPTEQRDAALQALTRSGMKPLIDPRNLSHEVAVFDGHVHVDLHWRLFRPGRSRFELAATLLERRGQRSRLWVLDDSANLLVMLVHPAFAKHVCGPAAKLIRLVELDRLIREGQPDWEWTLAVVSRAGLRTAAWSTLHWLRAMLDTQVDEEVLRRLRPGRLHRAYLSHWIDRNLPTRLAGIPFAVQGAFTLALHDRPTDALKAAVTLAATVFSRRREDRRVRTSI
jgi:hypothetical protein